MPEELLDQVKKVLVRRFGSDVRLENAAWLISDAINRSRMKGKLLYASSVEHTVNADYKRFVDALGEIEAVAPAMISEGRETVRSLTEHGFGDHSDIEDYKKSVEELASFYAEAKRMAEAHQLLGIKSSDPRSSWHQTAKIFAYFIEDDFRTANVPCDTRNSANSRLVVAVRDLLEMAGRSETEHAVRKALVGKSCPN